MTRDERLQLAERIGREFHARDMRQHLPPLRSYFAGVRDGRKPSGWDDTLVADWATAFRLPPFEHAVEIRAPSSSCDCNVRHDAERPMVFPGGALVTCLVCGRRWLEINECVRRRHGSD